MSADEHALRERFTREGLRPTRWSHHLFRGQRLDRVAIPVGFADLKQVVGWSNGPDAVYGEHAHPYGKVLVVASGSITLTINGGDRVVTMKRGDRLELPPQTPHSAVVGADGVVCFEAHIRRKRLDDST